MASNAPGEAQCGADDDVAPQAVPDGHHRAALSARAGVGDGEEIARRDPRGPRPRRPATPVPAPVVGHRGELREPAHRQPEAVPPVQRPVDENHRGHPRGRGRPRGEVEGGRIAHGQGRRYPGRPGDPIAAGRVGPWTRSVARGLVRPQCVAGRRHVRPFPGRSRLGQRQLAGVLRRLPAGAGARPPAPGAGPSPAETGESAPGAGLAAAAPAAPRIRRRGARRPPRCAARPPGSWPTWRPACRCPPPPACAPCRPGSSRSTA